MGGYERHSAPWSLRARRPRRASPPDFNGHPARGGLGPLRGDRGQLAQARAGHGGREGHAAHQRARGLHARQRVPARRERGARLLRRRRLLRPRAGRRRRDGQGDGRVDRRPASRRWTCGRWTSGASARTTARRRYTLKRTREVYETYYDIKYPGHERQAGRPLRVSSAYAWHRDHGAAFGEKSGWERVNWYEANAPAGDEALRPRGWAGRLWSPAIGAEHVACRERAALFDESSFAKIEVAGPGAADYLEWLCDNRVARDVGQITYTQMLNRRGGIECDFTVTRVEDELFSIVTGHRVRQPRPVVDPPPRAGRRVGAGERRDLALGVLRAVGPARPRRARAADARPARLRLHDDARARRRRRAGARAARDLHRRAGLGALLPDRVRRRAVARAVGGRRAARARGRRLPGDRHAAPGEGLPRVGGRHHARRDAARGGPGLLRQATTRTSPGATRSPAASRPSACAASCSTTRARSRWATSRCASTARSSGA